MWLQGLCLPLGRTTSKQTISSQLIFASFSPCRLVTRRRGHISLDFMELSTPPSGHDFTQVCMKLLTGLFLVTSDPEDSTAETAAFIFASSVFRPSEPIPAADRDKHCVPRRHGPDPAAPAGSGEAVAAVIGRVTAEVRALLKARQDRRTAELCVLLCERWGARGTARHGAHAAALSVAAFPALDGPLQGPCAHGA